MWKEQLAETRFPILFSCGSYNKIAYWELSQFRAFFFLCFTEERSQRFVTTWWCWVNIYRFFIFGWIILYKSQIPLGSPPNIPLRFIDLLYLSDIDLYQCYLLFHHAFRCQEQMCRLYVQITLIIYLSFALGLDITAGKTLWCETEGEKCVSVSRSMSKAF